MKALLLLVVVSSLAVGANRIIPAPAVERETITMEELRMSKRFGVGFSAAGPVGLLGIEVDLNLSEDFSVGGGIGTGLGYSTFMVKGRYFLIGDAVSPYLGVGYARWWNDEATDAKDLSPGILPNTFLAEKTDLSQGFDVHMVYPALGVQFMHSLGFEIFAELQYLMKLFDMSGGVYAGLGMHWYF
jgi:hypothetical protein